MANFALWESIKKFLRSRAFKVGIQIVIGYAYYLYKTIQKMRRITISNRPDLERAIVHFGDPAEYQCVDIDVLRGLMEDRTQIPLEAIYTLVAFHNGPEGIPIKYIEFVSRFFKLVPANLLEVVAIGENIGSKGFRALGLEAENSICAPGTFIKRASSLNAICCPVVSFSFEDDESDTKVCKKSIRLHDIDDDFPSDQFLLFRNN